MSSRAYDVAVVGGGIAGCAAAVAAARRRWRTLLIEERPLLGGTVTAGLHRFLCGLYANDPVTPFSLLNAGLSRELLARLDAATTDDNRVRMGRVEVHRFEPAKLGRVLDRWVREEPGLHVQCEAQLVGVASQAGRVERIQLRRRGSDEDLKVGALVDCSGEGVAGELAGAERIELAGERQLSGYSFEVEGLKQTQQVLEVAVPYTLRLAVDRGLLTPEVRFTKFLPLSVSRGLCVLSMPAESGASAFEWARQVHNLLVEDLEAFVDSKMTVRSPCVLHRDGGALLGRYLLTEADVIGGARFDDAAFACAWPIEFWHRGRGPEYRYVEGGAYYEVPFRCLRSSSVDNLFQAGRCLSATPRALASCRVAGACFASGEAVARAVEDVLGHRTNVERR